MIEQKNKSKSDVSPIKTILNLSSSAPNGANLAIFHQMFNALYFPIKAIIPPVLTLLALTFKETETPQPMRTAQKKQLDNKCNCLGFFVNIPATKSIIFS